MIITALFNLKAELLSYLYTFIHAYILDTGEDY